MKSPIEILEEKISAAMAAAAGQRNYPAMVTPATDAKFGDYQSNGIMALARELKTNPRKLAENVVKRLNVTDICESPEIAGPGFINLKLKADFVANSLLALYRDPENRLAIDKTTVPKTIVVDFSGPNIAKQMHVGHLRSTIIGDSICRMLEFLGHKVIRQNHIGDWGLQMGMVVYSIETNIDKYFYKPGERFVDQDLNRVPDLDTLERYYKEISVLAEHDADIADAVHDCTVRLQRGGSFAKSYWEHAQKITLEACYDLYRLLNVNLNEKHTRGESFYKNMLVEVVSDLQKQGLAEKSDDAVCIFPEGFKNKDGQLLPLIIQKSDGAYLYATTDLAAIRYRVGKLKVDRIIYVTDARQKLHFEMLFAVAKMAGWVKDQTELIHVTFGSVLGDNGKPLKTRTGENVKLKELLDEAVERAKQTVEEKNPELSPDKKEKIAKTVGIGAVKYADFSNNRTSDYIFSFDKMLAMEGNTAPYMQYAYARIKSIERRGQLDIEKELADVAKLNLTETAELDLAKYLIRYGRAINAAIADYRPNYLTSYLYELAQKFSVFYTNCPVLTAKPNKRPTRLLLCDLTAKTIKHGLSELLGIEVVEQM